MFELPKCDELTFDDERHVYRLNGAVIPSVTTLMRPLSNELYKGIDEEILNAAAKRGSAVHESIENFCKFSIEDIDPDYKGYFDAFMKWFADYKVEPLGNEIKVYHKALRYAGTADLPCVIDGKRIIVDFKTSAGVNKMLTGIQLEAYDKAFESHQVEFDGKAILHLKSDGKYGYYYYDKGDRESWEVFGALLTINAHIKKYK